MTKNNYEIMLDKMQLKFLEYDQSHMIEKFHLKNDGQYIYIRFVGREYRIGRKTGKAEWSEDGFRHSTAAGYNEAMSIYDVLCYSREGCCLSGRFSNINHLKGTVRTASVGSNLYQNISRYFDEERELLARACEDLGGKKEKIGDVSYCLYPFEFLPVMLQFWYSDEEFPASLKLMWDENILDFVHYETTYFIVGHIFDRLKERIEKMKSDRKIEEIPVIREMQKEKEVIWINPDKTDYEESMKNAELTMKDVEDAQARLLRFAPFIEKCFPETKSRNGIIESDLIPIPAMQEHINRKYDSRLQGKLLLKMDSHLAIAGSVKARGGIYEVLKHTEDLALEHGLLKAGDDYVKLADKKAREFFKDYTIQVGSTGNLGMSIGIMSAAIGYKVIVHMSADARQWKKDLLRSRGVTVVEYETDYSEAVKNGRILSDQNPKSYFVDDENSRNLFLGYAVAAKRLVGQLEELAVPVDEKHPLFVYIPCGVGGAPGGISFGLKQVFGDYVHCFFAEPIQAPCMLVGMATGLNSEISVQDIGLTGQTHADGLAVGRPSGFVGSVMKPMLSGEFTVRDANLYHYMRDLLETEDIFLEPSACAAFQGPVRSGGSSEIQKYLADHGLTEKMEKASHIVWATGGSLVPEEIREEYRNIYL